MVLQETAYKVDTAY